MKKSILYALLAVAAWSTMPAIGKSLLTEFNSFEVLGYGSLIGALFLTGYILIRGELRKIKSYEKRDFFKIAALGFIGYFIYSILYNTGLSMLPAFAAGTLNYVWPVFAIVLSAVFLGEKITGKGVLSVCLSLTGVCIMMIETAGKSGGSNIFGVICCLAGALFYAIFNIGNKKVGKSEMINMAIYLWIGAICAIACNIPKGFHLPVGIQWAGFLWIGIVIDALAYVFWAIALGRENTAVIVNFTYLTPVMAMVISGVLFHEKITVNTIIGVIFIVGGMAVSNHKNRNEHRKKYAMSQNI